MFNYGMPQGFYTPEYSVEDQFITELGGVGNFESAVLRDQTIEKFPRNMKRQETNGNSFHKVPKRRNSMNMQDEMENLDSSPKLERKYKGRPSRNIRNEDVIEFTSAREINVEEETKSLEHLHSKMRSDNTRYWDDEEILTKPRTSFSSSSREKNRKYKSTQDDSDEEEKEKEDRIDFYIDSQVLYNFLLDKVSEDRSALKMISKHQGKFQFLFDGSNLPKKSRKIKICELLF